MKRDDVAVWAKRRCAFNAAALSAAIVANTVYPCSMPQGITKFLESVQRRKRRTFA